MAALRATIGEISDALGISGATLVRYNGDKWRGPQVEDELVEIGKVVTVFGVSTNYVSNLLHTGNHLVSLTEAAEMLDVPYRRLAKLYERHPERFPLPAIHASKKLLRFNSAEIMKLKTEFKQETHA